MAEDPPYMSGVKNVGAILERIKSAGTPPKFTIEFLKTTLGFPSSTDRAMIRVLKNLGFLAADGTPLARYNEFRSAHGSGHALAEGLRSGWASVFMANQNAQKLSKSELKELFKTVTGKGEEVADDMAATFRALADLADWSSPVATLPAAEPSAESERTASRVRAGEIGQLRLHSDIHIHLPATSDVAVFTAIFRALRSELLD